MAEKLKLTESQERVAELSGVSFESNSYNGIYGQETLNEDAIANILQYADRMIASKGVAGAKIYTDIIYNALTKLSTVSPTLYKKTLLLIRQNDIEGLQELGASFESQNQPGQQGEQEQEQQ